MNVARSRTCCNRARVRHRVTRATADKEAPGVRTRFQLGSTASEAIAVLERLMVVDLAGPIAERRCLREAWQLDEDNALSRALRIVLLERGLEDDDLTEELRAEATELVRQMRTKAAVLVEENWPAIERVADALAENEQLNQAEIDALIAAET